MRTYGGDKQRGRGNKNVPQRAEVVRLALAGMSQADAGRLLGLSRQRIFQILESEGYRLQHRYQKEGTV